MPEPLRAYYGRDTCALLSRCAWCGGPYRDEAGWEALTGNFDAPYAVWLLRCPKCAKGGDGDGNDRQGR